MRNCPVCGESFGDELNFCDVDGTQLERDPADVAQEKNKLWSILGVALLVGALVISALSIIFLPKGRVSSPALVSSQPQPVSPETKLAAAETSSNPESSPTSSEPEALSPPDSSVTVEPKKKEPALGPENGNLSKSAKAAAQAAEEGDQSAAEPQPPAPVTPKKPETPAKTTSDTETPRATTPPSAEPKTAGSNPADNSNSKKKGDDKDKKKGGLFKVFKKIFGKD